MSNEVSVSIDAVPGVRVGVPSGPPGFSPSASVTENEDGALISITDASGTSTAQIYNGEVTAAQFNTLSAYALAAFPTDTASGAVASFPDGADGLPVKSLATAAAAAAITVAGKNIFDESAANWKTGYLIIGSGAESASSGYKYSQTFFKVRPNTVYAVQINKGSASSTAVSVPFYDGSQVFLSRVVVFAATTATGVMSGTFTTPADCEYIRLNVPANLTTDIQVEVGAAATAYEAYKGEVHPVDAADIKTFPGVNNIWADTGDVTVEYRADIGLFIRKKLAE